VFIGAVFCLGMLSTDTLDSVLVHRLISTRSSARRGVTRVWILSVTAVALAVAAYELAQVLGWQSPVPDVAVSGLIVAVLVAVFGYVLIRTRRERPFVPETTPGTTP
jgi:drug/metabolite transporter (DMT)-like permease